MAFWVSTRIPVTNPRLHISQCKFKYVKSVTYLNTGNRYRSAEAYRIRSNYTFKPFGSHSRRSSTCTSFRGQPHHGVFSASAANWPRAARNLDLRNFTQHTTCASTEEWRFYSFRINIVFLRGLKNLLCTRTTYRLLCGVTWWGSEWLINFKTLFAVMSLRKLQWW